MFNLSNGNGDFLNKLTLLSIGSCALLCSCRSFDLGKAVHTSTNGLSTEECFYEKGLRQGPSIDKRENGDVEERSYTNGILEGSAVLLGGNGDKLEFTYR